MSSIAHHPWPRGLAQDGADQLVVVLSDVELGAGGPTDDFPQSEFLAELLLAYNEKPFDELPVTVVFNGDTFDLLKRPYRNEYPTRVTGDVALGKLLPILAAHATLFEGLRRFQRHTAAPRRICFVAGNHDLELLFPAVQRAIRGVCGDEQAVLFPGLVHRVGDVHIEHGMQADPVFTVDAERPFVEHDGQQLLNLSWGAIALLEVAMPLVPVCYHLDRLKPREVVLERLPEVRDLLLGAYWRYWTRDYWREYFADADPLRKLSWTMLKEIVYRFGSKYSDVEMGDHYQRLLQQNEAIRLYVVGHQHEPGWWSVGDRKVLRTGCMRNEFMLVGDDEPPKLIPKVYAEVYLQRERVVRSHLVEVDAPPPPPGYLPESLFEVVPKACAVLESRQLDATVEADRAAQANQEATEARSAAGGELRLEAAEGFSFLRTLREALKGEGPPA